MAVKLKLGKKSKAVPRLTEYSPSYVLLKEQEEFMRGENQMIEKGLKK